MNWENRKVLVTGAGGFIGSHLCEDLVQLGADVTALVHYNSQNSNGWLDHSIFKGQLRIVAGDITDAGFVDTLVQGMDTIFHLAALIAIPYSYVAPDSYIQTNIVGTTNVLKAVRRYKNRRLLHTSTSEVYGSAQYVPINEAHPLQGQSPYSASKIGADMMADAYHRSFDVPVTTVRPFNTFGPRQSTRAVIPTIITQCLKKQTINLGSLTPTRDMNYVKNTTSGFINAAQNDAVIGETINFGSGREISISDLAAMIARLCDNECNIMQEEERKRPEKSEVERLLADHTKATELLNWTPDTSLEDGLTETIEWFSENLHKYETGKYVI